MKREHIQMPCLIVFLFLAGCSLATVKVDVVSERTTLENQVLGTYNSLDKEMLLAASVRGVDSQGRIRKPPAHSQEHKDVVEAMQVQAFHADDIDAFKRLRWVGEDNSGLLTSFPMGKESVPEDLTAYAAAFKSEEFNTIVAQVNEARQVLMQRVIEINENLTEEDLPKIQKIFGNLNAENALPGEKIQIEDGKWIVKE